MFRVSLDLLDRRIDSRLQLYFPNNAFKTKLSDLCVNLFVAWQA